DKLLRGVRGLATAAKSSLIVRANLLEGPDGIRVSMAADPGRMAGLVGGGVHARLWPRHAVCAEAHPENPAAAARVRTSRGGGRSPRDHVRLLYRRRARRDPACPAAHLSHARRLLGADGFRPHRFDAV